MTNSEADIIFSRASVALAKSQRLIASWLPPPTPSELAAAKSEEEIEREEREMFTAAPELLGLGAKLPADGDLKRQDLSANEKLRQQLLGKDYKKLQAKRRGKGLPEDGLILGSKPRPAVPERVVREDSEDEGGRSSLGKSKRKRHAEGEEANVEARANEATRAVKSRSDEASEQPRKASNYLDQVLAEKSRKKQHNQKRKRKRQCDAAGLE